jgi:hypothetical protein
LVGDKTIKINNINKPQTIAGSGFCRKFEITTNQIYMTNVRPYCVYKLTFPDWKIYFGVTINFNRRMRDHPRQAKFDKRKIRPIFHAINKYGWGSVVKEVLHSNLTTQEAYEMETALIREYNTTDLKNGYNLALGGPTAIGCKKSTNANKGRKLSEEWKAALRKGKKGKDYSEIAGNNSRKYSVIATIIKTGQALRFKDVSEFSEYTGINLHTVYNHIRRQSQVLNYKWNVRYNENLKQLKNN